MLRLSNNQVSVCAMDAVVDDNHRQLVAITISATEKQSLNSIMATLVTNSKRTLTLQDRVSYRTYYLQNAQRGYKYIPKSLAEANGVGHVISMEHPAAGDPRLSDHPVFYVTATKEEDIKRKFVDRLNTAITWPVMYWWADYLIENGLATKAVRRLDIISDRYTSGFSVSKDNGTWESIISAGIAASAIALKEQHE